MLLENEGNQCGPAGHFCAQWGRVHVGDGNHPHTPGLIGHDSPKITKPMGGRARQCPPIGPKRP
jgi:hypothetical protein